MLMLTLDDAVKVAKRLIRDDMDDVEIIRQELEQKCWFSPKADEAAKHLNDLIFDINPAEICSQIESGNLREWCSIVQTEMKMAMIQLPCWGEGEEVKKYKIELTEPQMRVLEKCTELYMRIMMGQTRDLSDELAFYNIGKYRGRDNFNEIHSNACDRRDAIQEVLRAVMRIAFPAPYHVPEEKTEDGMIAECIWDSVRCARGTSRWDSPFQIGSEPVPKIEVMAGE